MKKLLGPAMKEVPNIQKVFDFIIKINTMISERHTGSSAEFAGKLKITEDDLDYYLALLNKEGNNIGYSHADRTFYFKETDLGMDKWVNRLTSLS